MFLPYEGAPQLTRVLHRMLAELLIRTIQGTAVGLSIQPLALSELDPPRERLLPPLQPGNYETNTSSCWLGVRDEGKKRNLKGMRNVSPAPQLPFCTFKYVCRD